MEPELTGAQRRKKILELLSESREPQSGSALGRITGVSRQVVVQDMALLRTEGHPIVATARGYVLNRPARVVRLVKVCHTDEQTREELNLIVDLGGCVEDVVVNHRAYGKIRATMKIASRRDVENFMEQIRSGKSTLLMNVTSGYHFHHISAQREEILDEIQQALGEKGFLAEFLPYEKHE